jgi:hypothetical protein
MATFSTRGARTISLRRNFRNTKPIFQLAQLFYETKLDIAKLRPTLSRISSSSSEVAQLAFDRPVGRAPLLLNVDESSVPDYDSPSFPAIQERVMVAEYLRFITSGLDRAMEEGYAIDLLILVPDRDGSEARWTRQALEALRAKTGTGYLDLTQEDNRRAVAPENKVRLCTFHSCRGLEGAIVLIFGLERLPLLAARIDSDPFRLGYIVLSRALFEVRVVLRRSAENEVVRFVDAAVSVLNEREPSAATRPAQH